MDIQRWKQPVGMPSVMEVNPSGKYVRYKDYISEITTLRQQVEQQNIDIADFQKLYENMYEKLALRELEIVKLRESLVESIGYISAYTVNHSVVDNWNSILFKPFTPDHLNEWLKEQVEIQGYWKQGDDLAESDYFPIADFPHVDPTGCTPLYALKCSYNQA